MTMKRATRSTGRCTHPLFALQKHHCFSSLCLLQFHNCSCAFLVISQNPHLLARRFSVTPGHCANLSVFLLLPRVCLRSSQKSEPLQSFSLCCSAVSTRWPPWPSRMNSQAGIPCAARSAEGSKISGTKAVELQTERWRLAPKMSLQWLLQLLET